MGKDKKTISKESTKETKEDIVVKEDEAPKKVKVPKDSDQSPDSMLKFLKWGTNPTPQSFPTLPKYLYWFRVILATAYGTYMGTLGARGQQAIVVGFGMIFTIPTFYMERISQLDQEDWEASNLMMEGVIPALACFLFTWILFFTAFHAQSGEELLVAMAEAALLKALSSETDGVGGGIIDDAMAAAGGGDEAMGAPAAVGGDEF
jgi:hypothetical protein